MDVRGGLIEYALGLPEAYEDHPWGEVVAKVRKKVFVFFGTGDDPDRLGYTVKLAESHDQALSFPTVERTGYGLGRAGWVTVWLSAGAPPVGVCTDWIEESYRLVAPKGLVRLLENR